MSEYELLYWAGIPFHRLLRLNKQWEITVKPGQVIIWSSEPELVTRGNQTVHGYVYTMDRHNKTHRRKAEQYLTVPELSQQTGGETS